MDEDRDDVSNPKMWNSSLKCPVCSVELPTTHLSRHYEAYHITKTCPHCPYVASGAQDLEVHAQICEYQRHLGPEGTPGCVPVGGGFGCGYCLKRFAWERGLQAHLEAHHAFVQCGRCTGRLRPRHISRHMADAHPGQEWIEEARGLTSEEIPPIQPAKRLKCVKRGCEERFRGKKDLLKHVAEQHPGAETKVKPVEVLKELSINQIRREPAVKSDVETTDGKIPTENKFSDANAEVKSKMSKMEVEDVKGSIGHFLCLKCSTVLGSKFLLECHLSGKHQIGIAFEQEVDSCPGEGQLILDVIEKRNLATLVTYLRHLNDRLNGEGQRGEVEVKVSKPEIDDVGKIRGFFF